MCPEIESITFRDIDGNKVGIIKRGKDDQPMKIGKSLYTGPRINEIKYRR